MIPNPIIERLKSDGVDDSLFSGAQLLLMPENILHAGQGEELLETTDMDAFAKKLREVGAGVFTYMDAGIDLSAVDRNSGDKWLGTVWIRDHAVIPLLVTVIGGMILIDYERATTPSDAPPQFTPKVHIELIIDGADGQQKTVKYEGDGKTLIGILETLKDE